MRYKVSFDLGYAMLVAEDDDLLEAFNQLKFKGSPKVLKAVLTVKRGDKTFEKVFNMRKVKLFATNPITRGVWAKLIKQTV